MSIKTKPKKTCFGGTFGTSGFNEKSSFNNLLGFIPFRNYKPTNAIHADKPGVYISEEMLNLSTIKKSFEMWCNWW